MLKNMRLIFVAIIIASVGVAFVSASTQSVSKTVNLSSGGTSDVYINNCTQDGHLGAAKAITAPSSAMTINWKLYKNVSGTKGSKLENDSMSSLDDMIWHYTDVTWQGWGNFIHEFYMNGKYYGNLQGMNVVLN